MNPREKGHNPQNDIIAYADRLAGDPRYAEGASILRDITQALIENGDLPETILIQGEDSEVETVEDPVYRHPLFEHDRNERTLIQNGHTFQLTPIENELLSLLEDSPNTAVEHSIINRKIWGYENYNGTELSKGHISRIKSLLPFYDSRDRHTVIRAVKGVGYMLMDNSLKPEEKNKILIQRERKDIKVYVHRFFELYPETFTIKVGGKDISLTKLEKDLLEMVAKSPGRIVSAAELMSVFNANRYKNEAPNPQALKTHMSHLRKKIKDDREIDEPIIESKKGVGYRLNP